MVAGDFDLWYNNVDTRALRVPGGTVSPFKGPGRGVIQFQICDRKNVLRDLWLPIPAGLAFAGAPNITPTLEDGKNIVFFME